MRKTWVKVLVACFSVLMVIALIVGGFLYYTFTSTMQDTGSTGELNLGEGEQTIGAQNVLLVGTDSRTDAQGNELTPEQVEQLHAGDETGFTNTDTIILLHIPQEGVAKALSIPRDSYVSTGQGNMKINGVYAAGQQAARNAGVTDQDQIDDEGRKALISQVQSLTGASIDHYAEVGLLGFVTATDALGGVNVCLNAAVNDGYSGANFPAGRQELSGTDALKFVRQRHGLPRGDIDRIARQQVFLASMLSRAMSSSTWLNPIKISGLADTVQKSLTLDPGWDALTAAQEMRKAGTSVEFATIPVTSIDGRGDNGESIVTVSPGEVREFVHAQFGGDVAQPTVKKHDYGGYTVEVVNAGSRDNLASNVAAVLRADGAVVEVKINRGVSGQVSQVLATSEADPTARAVSQRLGGLPIAVNPQLPQGRVRVVLSDSYQGPTTLDPVDPAAPPAVGEVGSTPVKSTSILSGDIPCVN